MQEMAKEIVNNLSDTIDKKSCVYGEEDLKRIRINSPPSDGKCDVCKRHISELKPFGGVGDPLVGKFNGVLLLKGFRRFAPYNEKAENAVAEAINRYADDGYKDPLEWMKSKFGKKEGEKLYYWSEAYHQNFASWECRECCSLDTNEYFEIISRRSSKD